MYRQWKRATRGYTCKHCEGAIAPGSVYLFVRRYGGNYNMITEAACEACGDTYDKLKLSNAKPGPRRSKLRRALMQPRIKYRVICPYCRKGRIVETVEKAHEWMRTHVHGMFMYGMFEVHPENVIISLVKDRRFCYDGDEAQAALANSALKWLDILHLEGFAVDEGPENCPLCSLYREGRCARCPIYRRTGKALCEGTPYHDWWTHHWLEHNQWHDLTLHADCPECRVLAKNELDFLLSLAEGEFNACLL